MTHGFRQRQVFGKMSNAYNRPEADIDLLGGYAGKEPQAEV